MGKTRFKETSFWYIFFGVLELLIGFFIASQLWWQTLSNMGILILTGVFLILAVFILLYFVSRFDYGPNS